MSSSLIISRPLIDRLALTPVEAIITAIAPAIGRDADGLDGISDMAGAEDTLFSLAFPTVRLLTPLIPP
jgi:hypothetical protein